MKSPIEYGNGTMEIIFDTNTIHEGESKIIKIWSWRRLKNLKYLITNNGINITIQPLENIENEKKRLVKLK